jgi:predicted Na+-dependent transporter
VEERAMTVCKDIKSFSHTHERIADLFSLLAVVLLFATVWAVLEYYQVVLEWWRHNMLLNSVILVAILALDVFLILGFLAIGSARFGEEDEKCFGTFRGRRNSGVPGGVFRAWLNHMENVGKKHR